MTMSRKHVAWAGVGLTLALTVGSPPIADGTELLLSNPNSVGADKPNILFILDSSGSMTTVEKTQEPYDGTKTYDGTCNTGRYYWTKSGNTPSSNWNNQYIDKDRFLCEQGLN